MQLFSLKRELLTPAEHVGIDRTLRPGVVKKGELATELIGMIRTVHAGMEHCGTARSLIVKEGSRGNGVSL